ncbi:hypothetical protein [Butyrivibrio sp. WCE2006]|uniref:hypothetical protein n=1 Tax=Butyrivibrio sp. WCE2006 TaxID=1410611 RepID=UPI0005D1800C|nr:hypothetical protein [Butyrivibrio sp. WCE2006]
MSMIKSEDRAVFYVNLVLVVLEILAFIHDIYVFRFGLFTWYTVDSNVMQMVVSGFVIYYVVKGRTFPKLLTVAHFISAVALTVTFLIAAFVLAPEGGVAYYFFNDVAPINHFIGPLLSVISLLFLEKSEKLPFFTIIWPAAASLLYGVIALVLNAARIMDGPYFFLKVYEQPAVTIITWFAIIAVLCFALAFLYYKVKWRNKEYV